MQILSLATFLSCHLALGSAFSIPHRESKAVKRGETGATLYAYGTNSSGWPVSYSASDNLLYIAATSNDSAAGLSTILWDLAGVTSENWQANATLSNGTAAGSLYIVPEAFNAVGVRDSAGVLEMNGTDTGFALFGTQLVYNNNSVIESQFWAQSTATEGIYALKWNTDGAMKENSFPVMVKAVENV